MTDLPIENTKMMEVLTKDFDGEKVVIQESVEYPIRFLKLEGHLNFILFYTAIIFEIFELNTIPYNLLFKKNELYIIPRNNEI